MGVPRVCVCVPHVCECVFNVLVSGCVFACAFVCMHVCVCVCVWISSHFIVLQSGFQMDRKYSVMSKWKIVNYKDQGAFRKPHKEGE